MNASRGGQQCDDGAHATHGIPTLSHVMQNAAKRARIDPREVEDVVIGCGLPEGATGHNIARNAALYVGFGDHVQ